MLDSTSPLPLYQQLADTISEQIRAGEYQPGARIPSEHELAAHYGLGRPTVRQATEVLVRKRVLERKRGAGTFVSERRPEVDLFSLGGTLASFRRSGVDLRTRWLKKLALRNVGDEPDNPFSGKRVFTAERLGSVARQPVLLERLYLDPDVFPGADAAPRSSSSLSQYVAERFQLKPRAGRQTFRVHHLDASMAQTFKLPKGKAIVLVRRALDFPARPGAIFAELFCHTDEMVFAQDIGGLDNA